MNDLTALALSAALVAAAFASSFILTKVSAPLWLSRKACHIIVSFWVFIMAGCFETTSARVIGPALFTIVNLVLSRTGASASAGIGKGGNDIALVFYPVSLLIVSVLYSYGSISSDTAIASIMILGLGDGSAAIAGHIAGKKDKSLVGSIAMVIVSFLLVIAITGLSFPYALLVALAVSAVERITPHGYDNLTVPVAAVLLLEVLCIR